MFMFESVEEAYQPTQKDKAQPNLGPSDVASCSHMIGWEVVKPTATWPLLPSNWIRKIFTQNQDKPVRKQREKEPYPL